MITVQNETFKGGSLNLGAHGTLEFDADGICADVAPEIAVLLSPMKGMLISGMDGDVQHEADKRKTEISTLAASDKNKGTTIRGFQAARIKAQDDAKKAAESVPRQGLHTIRGKIPKSVQARVDKRNDAAAARLKLKATPKEVVEEVAEAPAPVKKKIATKAKKKKKVR